MMLASIKTWVKGKSSRLRVASILLNSDFVDHTNTELLSSSAMTRMDPKLAATAPCPPCCPVVRVDVLLERPFELTPLPNSDTLLLTLKAPPEIPEEAPACPNELPVEVPKPGATPLLAVLPVA